MSKSTLGIEVLAVLALSGVLTSQAMADQSKDIYSWDKGATARIYWNRIGATGNNLKVTGFHLRDAACDDKAPYIKFHTNLTQDQEFYNLLGCRGGNNGDEWFARSFKFNGTITICNPQRLNCKEWNLPR